MRILGVALLVAVSVVLLSAPAEARVGVGVFAGEPSGLSAKWWLDDAVAVDGVVGWSIEAENFYFHTDYLWHRIIEDRELGGSVPFYFGIGARFLAHDEDARFGARIPFGLNYFLDDGRFDIFVEIAPIFDVVPETEFDLSAGVGARFYF